MMTKQARLAFKKHKKQHLEERVSLMGLLGNFHTGIHEISAMEIVSEAGIDMSKWPSDKHFNSWLALAPNTKISGGKVISSKVPKTETSCWSGISYSS